MGVFTCHKPKAFVCVFIELVYHCIQWKLKESEYDSSNAKADRLSCPIVESKYVFTRFKTLEDLSAVAVEGSIVSKIFKIQ
jgi:hypothetical protein